ncbi:hypothetical protein BDV93DRAFT_108263 [Ceratobasidium sp. AG-I]|nr:hypothetical protein BDV93DRAFT_108263 [Ceratobasidium sp. AG-I]
MTKWLGGLPLHLFVMHASSPFDHDLSGGVPGCVGEKRRVWSTPEMSRKMSRTGTSGFERVRHRQHAPSCGNGQSKFIWKDFHQVLEARCRRCRRRDPKACNGLARRVSERATLGKSDYCSVMHGDGRPIHNL